MSQQQSRLNAYDEDSAFVAYRCPYCDFEDEREWLVRSHINLSDAEPHHHRDGFMPEDELDAIDASGEVIETVTGNPRNRFETLNSLETDDMPSGLTETERIVVLTALQNLTENYSGIQELANDRLREAGLEGVDYNKAYRTVIETLSVARKSKKMSQTQEEKSYEDLTDKQRAVINEFIRDPDQSMTSLAENAGVDGSYPAQVIEKYGHIAEGMTNADVVPVDGEEEVEDRDESAAPTSPNDPTPATEKSYEQLTDLQREVVDQLVEHPEKSNKQIAADVGCDETYPGKVEEKFAQLISERRAERTDDKGRVTVGIDDQQYLVDDELASDFTDLTTKQQAVIIALMDETDPKNPSSEDEIAEKAGVHRTYVSEVTKKYGSLAVRMKTEAFPADEAEGAAPESAEESADDSGADEQPDDRSFEERFREAVEAGEPSRLTVRELESGLDTIEDDDLLNQALEQDTRKTATTEYEARLAELEPEEEERISPEEPREPESADEDEPQVEWTDEEDDADEEEELSFVEQLRAAVEDGDITNLTVREIEDGLDEVEDVGLLRDANDLDSRKTSTTTFEDRIDELVEEPEAEPEAQSVESAEPESEPEPEPEPASAPPAESTPPASAAATDAGGIPASELESMRERAEMLIRTAESELENSDQKAPAARAKSVAEEFERMIDDSLARHGASAQEQTGD